MNERFDRQEVTVLPAPSIWSQRRGILPRVTLHVCGHPVDAPSLDREDTGADSWGGVSSHFEAVRAINL